MAPEVIQQSYDERADIWSAGIMMYQLLTGEVGGVGGLRWWG
jgi:serine/threonine protein kinase